MPAKRINRGKEGNIKNDIEESDEVLDKEEIEPIKFWEDKQRELVSSIVDYNLESIAKLVETKSIDVDPKYQRRHRWNSERKSKLIESFLMNVPVPPIFLNEDSYGKYSVIDGKQRLLAITDFFGGKLKLTNLEVFSDINCKIFYELPYELQLVLKTRPTLRAVIILRQSDEDVKFEVFKRLNTGGVSLNPQEIRNSTYTGPLNNLLLELSENSLFHQMLGIKNKQQSKIYQEMRDVELVLRYLAFKDSWSGFTGGIKKNMDTFMFENRRAKTYVLKNYKNNFISTLELVQAAFGDFAFKRWMPKLGRCRNQVLASLFDAQMFACQYIKNDKLAQKKDEIIKEYKKLFKDPKFLKTIDAATNTPSYFVARINMLRDLLKGIIE